MVPLNAENRAASHESKGFDILTTLHPYKSS